MKTVNSKEEIIMGKVVFLDVDGTLCDYDGVIPESAKQAIGQARRNGHKVYICTGRSRAEVYQEIWDIGLDGMIGGNGSYVEDRGSVVYHKKLSEAEEREVVDWLNSRGLEFYVECNSGLYASKNFETAGEETMKKYVSGKGQADVSNVTVRSSFPEMIFGASPYRDDANKISFILGSYQDFLDARDRFSDLKAGTWGGKDEQALFGDLGVKDIDKAHAIDVLLEHLDAKREDTIAFGDAKVDIPMFEYCGTSVCVGNGGDEAKKAADIVAPAVDDDGLFSAFQELGLI